jgi:acetyl/propionyl-CoA carboxylase alpha subunit
MTDRSATIAGEPAAPATGWGLAWSKAIPGLVQLTDGDATHLALVEGSGSGWVVTLHGRRIPVEVLTWRERTLAEAESGVAERSGPVEVRATLPGLVVAVAVAEGDEVVSGAQLLTVEAMKMQNEVRAPRAGRIASIVVTVGQTVAAGAALLRIE